jgi:hypothetical protein
VTTAIVPFSLANLRPMIEKLFVSAICLVFVSCRSAQLELVRRRITGPQRVDSRTATIGWPLEPTDTLPDAAHALERPLRADHSPKIFETHEPLRREQHNEQRRQTVNLTALDRGNQIVERI